MVELSHIDDIADSKLLHVDLLFVRLAGEESRARALRRFLQFLPRLLHGAAAALYAEVIELRLEALDDLLRLTSRASHEICALLPRLLEHLLLLLANLILQRLRLFLKLRHALLPFQDFGVPLLVHELFAFELVHDLLELCMIGLDELLCTQDCRLRKAEAAADGKGVACARHPRQQTVRRAQRLDIEFHTGIFDALARKSERLQLRVMRRHDRRGAACEELLKDRHGESRPFLGVGSRADLIEQQEIRALDTFQEFDQMRHVRGKCAEALLDALLVADDRIDIRIYGNLRSCGGRDVAARLYHERKKSDRLQADCLAARIWSCDEQHAIRFSKRDVNGHDLCRIDQRMTRGDELRPSLAIDRGARRLHIGRKLRPCEDEVKRGEYGTVLFENTAVLSNFLREKAQDALHLGLLRERKLLEIVVEIDESHRLDEKRRAARRLVVDDTWKALAILLFDRYDISLRTLCDDGVLKEFLILRAVQDGFHLLLRPAPA